jgi:hypothetical protein
VCRQVVTDARGLEASAVSERGTLDRVRSQPLHVIGLNNLSPSELLTQQLLNCSVNWDTLLSNDQCETRQSV